jgi:hypothetical protein
LQEPADLHSVVRNHLIGPRANRCRRFYSETHGAVSYTLLITSDATPSTPSERKVGRFRRVVVSAQLRATEAKLAAVGPTNAYDCLERVSVERLNSRYGIGPGTVEVLERSGYLTAADLHNEIVQRSDLTRLFGIGTARAGEILDWAADEWARCRSCALHNRQCKFALETRRDELHIALGLPPLGHDIDSAAELDADSRRPEDDWTDNDESPEQFLRGLHWEYDSDDD